MKYAMSTKVGGSIVIKKEADSLEEAINSFKKILKTPCCLESAS